MEEEKPDGFCGGKGTSIEDEEVAVIAVRPELSRVECGEAQSRVERCDRANPATPYRVDSSGEECGSGTDS